MKTLYMMVRDGGDGSYYVNFTFNRKLIDKLKDQHHKGLSGHGDLGCDGDGFHWQELNLPDECTAESLGIRLIDETDVLDDED